MPLTFSALQLDNFWVDEIEVRSFPAEKPMEGAPKPTVKIEVRIDRKELQPGGRKFLTSLALELKTDPAAPTPKPPYALRLVVTGQFTIHEETDDKRIDDYKRLNAPAILYGVARGIAGCVTGIGLRGRLNIPAINIASIYEDAGSETQAKSRKTPAKREPDGKTPAKRKGRQKLARE